jgi:hypothetical protein
MNRVLAVAVTAATATMVAGAAIVPAMAAQRPAHARTAATASAKKSGAKAAGATTAESRAKLAAQHSAASALAPLQITSQLGNGQYVTVVQCHGSVKTPPPVEVGQPDAPLTVHGSGLTSGMLATMKKPNAYKTVYACTVVVKERVAAKPKPRTAGHRSCTVVSGTGSGAGSAGGAGGKRCKKVTLNTGFGGMASKVAQHHPAG